MADNQEKNLQDSFRQPNSQNQRQPENSDFIVSNEGQNLGGGKSNAAGEQNPAITQDQIDTGSDFATQTDQTIAQAVPGQTVNNTTQGGSNA